jgi:hypothetical protein
VGRSDRAVERPRGGALAPYRPRDPAKTVLYRVVQGHFETYVALCAEGDGADGALPGPVEREFRRYLDCGILAHGFARARCPQCGHDFLVAFSCKGRGVCPSCTSRRMVETAAHLVDHVFPRLPVRQWVLSLPKRLRYFLRQDRRAVTAVLTILLRQVERALRESAPEGTPEARLGAVSFLHRFGSALNEHIHFHCVVIDGVFAVGAQQSGPVRFCEAHIREADIEQLHARVRQRVLRWFTKQGYLDPDDAQDMAQWANGGGFSLDASVRIEAHDRKGLERLLRYCARPAFASERLEELDADRLLYHLPKPRPDGRTELLLSPLELIQRLAALVPPPRRHRHRYHGVLAPNAPLRAAVTALAPQPPAAAGARPAADPTDEVTDGIWRSPARYLWAMLLARLYEAFPLACPNCGASMRLIAFLTDGPTVRHILAHIGAPTEPPRIAPARGPPDVPWDEVPFLEQDIQSGDPPWDPVAQPDPGYDFDQRRAG